MRKLFSVVAAGALALAAAAPASAAPVNVSGSINIVIGTLPGLALPIPTTSVDVTGGTLTIPAGIAATSGLFVPVTGFPLNLITGIVVTASNGAGSFSVPGPADGGAANIPGGGFGGKMPILGVTQVKGALAINVPLSVIGNGGSISAGGIVVDGAPWTTGAAKVTTTGAPKAMFAQVGGMVGVLGADSSTVTLVTPAHVNAAGLARLPVFAVASLHFINAIPEPGTALLLGTGLAGLVALGRKKMTK
jgi:hypothetical protein